MSVKVYERGGAYDITETKVNYSMDIVQNPAALRQYNRKTEDTEKIERPIVSDILAYSPDVIFDRPNIIPVASILRIKTGLKIEGVPEDKDVYLDLLQVGNHIKPLGYGYKDNENDEELLYVKDIRHYKISVDEEGNIQGDSIELEEGNISIEDLKSKLENQFLFDITDEKAKEYLDMINEGKIEEVIDELGLTDNEKDIVKASLEFYVNPSNENIKSLKEELEKYAQSTDSRTQKRINKIFNLDKEWKVSKVLTNIYEVEKETLLANSILTGLDKKTKSPAIVYYHNRFKLPSATKIAKELMNDPDFAMLNYLSDKKARKLLLDRETQNAFKKYFERNQENISPEIRKIAEDLIQAIEDEDRKGVVAVLKKAVEKKTKMIDDAFDFDTSDLLKTYKGKTFLRNNPQNIGIPLEKLQDYLNVKVGLVPDVYLKGEGDNAKLEIVLRARPIASSFINENGEIDIKEYQKGYKYVSDIAKTLKKIQRATEYKNVEAGFKTIRKEVAKLDAMSKKMAGFKVMRGYQMVVDYIKDKLIPERYYQKDEEIKDKKALLNEIKERFEKSPDIKQYIEADTEFRKQVFSKAYVFKDDNEMNRVLNKIKEKSGLGDIFSKEISSKKEFLNNPDITVDKEKIAGYRNWLEDYKKEVRKNKKLTEDELRNELRDISKAERILKSIEVLDDIRANSYDVIASSPRLLESVNENIKNILKPKTEDNILDKLSKAVLVFNKYKEKAYDGTVRVIKVVDEKLGGKENTNQLFKDYLYNKMLLGNVRNLNNKIYNLVIDSSKINVEAYTNYVKSPEQIEQDLKTYIELTEKIRKLAEERGITAETPAKKSPKKAKPVVEKPEVKEEDDDFVPPELVEEEFDFFEDFDDEELMRVDDLITIDINQAKEKMDPSATNLDVPDF